MASPKCSIFIIATFCVALISSQGFNPSILQDTRDLPKTDGTFGFLYRTEDGIAHAAKGDSDGVVHGRFTYTDPTGLKVNYNYNAGSRVAPGYNYDSAPAPRRPAPPPRDYDEPEEYREPPQPQQQHRYRQPPVQFRDSADVYQQRRSRPPYGRPNELNDYN